MFYNADSGLSATPITYRRQMGDGSVEVYAQSNGSTSFPRNIFLSQVIDPQGNALAFTYDGQLRLTTVTDATGRQTTLAYGLPARPLQVTQITDPFGRSATLAYDASGRLSSITDIIGLTSSFTYDANSLVNSSTTSFATPRAGYQRAAALRAGHRSAGLQRARGIGRARVDPGERPGRHPARAEQQLPAVAQQLPLGQECLRRRRLHAFRRLRLHQGPHPTLHPRAAQHLAQGHQPGKREVPAGEPHLVCLRGAGGQPVRRQLRPADGGRPRAR
jgi:YD repeat-containing protein